VIGWPLGLLVLLVALGAWRVGDERGETTAPPPEPVAPRAFGELRLDVPRAWRTLDRTSDHVTWGAADRSHTVTLASTEASTLPLSAVVREVARQSSQSVPGTRVVEGPTLLELGDRAPRDDAAALVRLEVVESGRRLDVVQVWRRDSRAGVDVVATWASTDGAWPLSPRDALPRASGTR
jgi:hypothetical protein